MNEETSVGLKKGGTLTIVRAEVELMVTAGNIPDHIEADLENLEIGQTINISDITLPEGTRPVIADRDFVIANIAAPGGAADDEDEDAAELMGVDTFKFKLWAFAIGAAIGGLAGSLYAGKVQFINPSNFPLQLSILFLAAVVLGGAGNMWGAVVGGALVAWMPERFRGFADKRVFVFGVALVLVMVFRPQGLIPRKIRKERWLESWKPSAGTALGDKE